MIANGGKTVNEIRSERCAAVRIIEPEPGLPLLREPNAAPVPSDLVEILPKSAWQSPETGEKEVMVDLFVTLSEAKDKRSLQDGLTRTRDNLVTMEVPLARLPALEEDPEVQSVEI